MKFLSSAFQRMFAPGDPDAAIKANPRNISAWIRLIDTRALSGSLSPHAMALIKSHDLYPTGHAVNYFAADIAKKGGEALERLAADPTKNVEPAIEELVKWKTAIQCGHSHDVSKGYFIDAEPAMELQWNQIIFPLIRDLDFTTVLDLACGHGRNSEFLRRHTKFLHLVDINQTCIDACRTRFGDTKDGTRFYYHVTDGNHLKMIPNDGITLVYTWDSMVHFDKLIVRDYLLDIKRVLKPGGSAFLHHSNFGEMAPDSNWATNTGTRSDMSGKIMREYAAALGLDVVLQKIQGRAEGWGEDGLDCVSILQKRGV
ncbi:ubiquinone/menaquinone biosynthesis C-methylase UbiE [Bradyrhizobium sp. AZCC 1578]|uniref:class I SAM-dependent methyltransferase n=1 Tax=unclassified Bradyrhizobium TaxID=2631580 RepID=UPI002FF14316